MVFCFDWLMSNLHAMNAVLCSFLVHFLPIARYHTRKMLNLLSSSSEFDELARKALNDHQYIKMKETAEHIKVKVHYVYTYNYTCT